MAWAGAVHLDPGQLTYYGTVSDIPLHSSIAIGLILVTEGVAELTDEAGHTVELRPGGPNAAVLPPGESHAKPMRPDGAPDDTRAVLAVLDPERPEGQRLMARIGSDRHRPQAWVDAAAPATKLVRPPAPDDPAGAALVAEVVRELAASEAGPAPSVHPAVRRAAELIPARLAAGVELQDLAAEVGLSASRLGHLFAVELGLPYRAYVRWSRLQKVVQVLREGATLTAAAHAAGFTDSAHMNRVCRSVFGVNPSQLISNLTWV
jgi:AraC-like DNA-binding protein